MFSRMFFSRDMPGGLRFFATFAGIGGIALLAFAAVELRRDTELISRGVRVTGIVQLVDQYVDTSSKTRRETYQVTVEYPTGGTSTRRRFPAGRELYERGFGTRVDVIYDPRTPTSARLAADLASGSGYKVPGAFGLALVGTAIGFLIAAGVIKKRQIEGTVADLDEALASARRPGPP